MGKKMITSLAIILLIGILASGCRPTQPTPTTNTTQPAVPEGSKVGDRAIDFELQTLEGRTVKLSDMRGKPVLLNFWATWCGPCRSEMPYLQQISDNWTAKGLVVLEVDVGESPDTVQNL